MTSMSSYKSNRAELQHRIAQIDSLFANSSEQILYLYGFIPGGLKCQCCESTHLEFREGNRKADCLVCGKLNFLTAKTFLHGVRRLPDWVRAMWLLEDGVIFSANMFSSVTGMASSSASSMLATLSAVILEYMPDSETEYSGSFAEIFHRRSLQTPALKHPVSEQDIFDELEDEKMAASLDGHLERCLNELYDFQVGKAPKSSEGAICGAAIAPASSCTTVVVTSETQSAACSVGSELAPATHSQDWTREKAAFSLLSKEPRTFDWLSEALNLPTSELTLTLVHLQLADLVTQQPGQRYVRKRLLWVDNSNADGADKAKQFKPFFDFVRRVFQGISRKYLQLYLAVYWCSLNRRRWGVGRLFSACMRSRRRCYRARLNFVSPPVVAYCLHG